MICVVVKPHTSNYSDPIRLEPGDAVTLGRKDDAYPGWIWVTDPAGRVGWAPESMIRAEGDTRGVTTATYTARELNTRAGERLTLVRELAGWLWVENECGESGWVPEETVRMA